MTGLVRVANALPFHHEGGRRQRPPQRVRLVGSAECFAMPYVPPECRRHPLVWLYPCPTYPKPRATNRGHNVTQQGIGASEIVAYGYAPRRMTPTPPTNAAPTPSPDVPTGATIVSVLSPVDAAAFASLVARTSLGAVYNLSASAASCHGPGSLRAIGRGGKRLP
jgi:hypothetical protein